MKSNTTRTFFLFLFSLIAAGAMLPAQQKAPVRENLGPNVNSEYDEVLPVISADGKTLFFDRKGHPGNTEGPKDDIWYSEKQANGSWGPARNIGWPLNTRGPNYVCAALPDNNTLLLGNQYLPDGSLILGVSMTFRSKTGWQVPTSLVITHFRNDNRNGLAEYTISPDGRVLVMSVETPASLGGRDLYVSFLMDDGSWSEPVNMGADINSPNSDITPFIAADGKTIYFSSDRPGGYGKNDVYLSRRLDDTWLHWSMPANLGLPVNSAGWDAYYTVPASGEYAYFVSTADGIGRSDIFRIRLPKELRPEPVVLVKGRVTDSLGVPVKAGIVYERFSDRKEIGRANIDPATGAYTMVLPVGDRYGFRAEAFGYFPVSDHIDARSITEYTEMERNLVLVPFAAGATVKLNNIFFAFDQTTLDSASQLELDRLVGLLKEQQGMKIEISGYTDDVGDEEYNLRLSQMRAQSVVDYLIAKGIKTSRLTAMGYGKLRPVSPNTTEEGRKANRRVEFTIK
jgi:outer membrane protein OmpA-like peptidoglycan-associated protein